MSAQAGPSGERARRPGAPPAPVRTMRIAALGERERLRGFAFAGVHLAAAEDAPAVRAAWQALPDDVGLVILTAAAHAALAGELAAREERLWVTMPA